MASIGIIGSTGHFGGIITKHLATDLPDHKLKLLSRKEPVLIADNIQYSYFDFDKPSKSKIASEELSLIVDLSGPVKKDDGKSAEIALKNKIPFDSPLNSSESPSY